jgi:PDZ domain-containing protein
MSRRVLTLITGAVLLLALLVGGSQLPVPYAELGPGPTLNTLGVDQSGNEIIQISGGRSAEKTSGNLNLTTVSVRDRLDLLGALRGWLDPDRAVVPREEIFPPGQTQQQTDQKNTQDFVDSQNSAELAALAHLKLTEVVVSTIPDDSPSHGKLAAKDVITALQGRKVADTDQLGSILQATTPGTTVTVDYERNGKPGTTQVTTARSTADGKVRAALGVTITLASTAKFKVKIGLDDRIGGPSAGLMFALGILEKLGPEDLTGGRFIAGTGTIDLSGAVGPIGGIPLKLIAAKDKGATAFLVPAGNCAEASRRPPAGLTLIKVDSLDSALSALEALQAGQPTPAC